MNENKIYTSNYYNLRMSKSQDSFIEGLNQTNIVDLVSPSLMRLTDKLYLKIVENKDFKDFHSLLDNETDVNVKVNEILSQDKYYLGIGVKGVSSTLFTDAFSTLCERVFLRTQNEGEKDILQPLVRQWLEDNLAKVVARDNRYEVYDILRKLIQQTEMLSVFYDSFIESIQNDWISKNVEAWTEVADSPTEILDTMSHRTFNEDYFSGYSRRLEGYRSHSPWKYIVEATRYSDQAMFKEEYYFKNLVMLKRNIPLWMTFWDKLKWPFLQDIALHSLELPQDILNITNQLTQQKEALKSSPKHLTYILLKNLYDYLSKVRQNLSFYIDQDRVSSLSQYEKDDELLSKGKEIFSSWDKEEEEIYSEAIRAIVKILSREEIAEWVFSYRPKPLSPYNIDKLHAKETENMVKAYASQFVELALAAHIDDAAKDFNLQRFDFLLSGNSNDIKVNDAKRLLDLLADFVRSEKFYWDKTFSPEYWTTLKGIGTLLGMLENPIKAADDFARRFRVYSEGWNTNQIDYQAIQREAFVYCGTILLLEHVETFNDVDARTAYFTSMLDLIVVQKRFTIVDVENAYDMPLYLLGLVANQIYPDLKELYESEILKNVDSIDAVIRIFNSAGYPLLQESKQLLKQRTETEFLYERSKLSQRNQTQQLGHLEKAIEKLLTI